jgi:hypothetical protein
VATEGQDHPSQEFNGTNFGEGEGEMKKLGLFTICLLLINSIVLAQTKSGVVAQKKPGASGQARAERRMKPHRDNYGGCDVSTPVATTAGLGFRDFMPIFGDNFVMVNLKAGHSYSVEVWDPTEANQFWEGGGVFLIPTLDCSTADPNWSDIWTMDPDISGGFSDRVSRIQDSDVTEWIDISSFDTSLSHNYEMRIVDTTLYNSRWSTVVGFSTHYGFLNTTENNISGTLTLTESGGTQHVVNFTVPAGGEVFEVIAGDGSGSPGLNLPPNLAGSASFAFVGSPGAIKADGYFQAVQNGVFVIVPTAWGPRNNQ